MYVILAQAYGDKDESMIVPVHTDLILLDLSVRFWLLLANVGDENESSTVMWSCYSGFLVNHVEQDGALSHTKVLMAEKMRTVIPYSWFCYLVLRCSIEL